MSIDEIVKLIESATKLVVALAWPVLVGFVLVRFGPALKSFFESIGEFSLKGPFAPPPHCGANSRETGKRQPISRRLGDRLSKYEIRNRRGGTSADAVRTVDEPAKR